MGFEVLFEEVAAEVVFEVAPDGVGVVGVVLGVGVFHEEGFALDAEVVRVALFESAGPGEVDLAEVGGLHFGDGVGDGVGGMVVEVGDDEVAELGALVVVHVAGGDALHFEGGDGAFLAGDDVVGGLVGEDDGFAGGFEGGGEGAAQVFDVAEGAEAFAGAFGDFGGVGAEKDGGEGEGLAVGDGDVDREVVALEAPAPGAAGFGGAEDGDVVFLRVAEDRVVFADGEELLKAHDGGGAEESLGAEGGSEEAEGEGLLGRF